MTRSPKCASPAGENGRGPGIHNENKAEDLQRLRAALEPFARALAKYEADCFFASWESAVEVPDDYPVPLPGYEDPEHAAKVTIGDFRRTSQALSSVVGEGDQGLSSSCTDLGGDGERAATEGQRKSEGGET